MISHLESIDSEDYARFFYCLNMGFTHLAINAFEDRIINMLSMCDQVKVKSLLGNDAEAWKLLLEKRDKLQSSTLGNLIKILNPHLANEDARYLDFLKKKRDEFVHRFFRNGEWPGDLGNNGCRWATRRLLAINIIFTRANERFLTILVKNKLLHREPMSRHGEAGFLYSNPNFLEKIFEK